MDKIKIVLLFSGKRKSGKDFITQKLHEKLKDKSQIIRISAPIKTEWASKLNLNLDELLSDGPYKEKYRKDMIEWSDCVRSDDYGFFCRKAFEEASNEIVIVSDVRRKTDIKFFREICGSNKLKILRINCSDQTRIRRGWKWVDGIDNIASECDLDDFQEWDFEIENNGENSTNSDDIVNEIIQKFNLRT